MNTQFDRFTYAKRPSSGESLRGLLRVRVRELRAHAGTAREQTSPAHDHRRAGAPPQADPQHARGARRRAGQAVGPARQGLLQEVLG